jgi:hypothetical protein
MSTFKRTLVVAGMLAVAGLGCSRYRSTKTYEPGNTSGQSSSSTVTTPATPATPQPGTEAGTGGAGMEQPVFPQSTPSTTTDPSSNTGEPLRDHQDQPINNNTTIENSNTLSPQPGTGGSGLDVSKPGLDVKNPDECNRNQIGSPSSSIRYLSRCIMITPVSRKFAPLPQG